MTESTTTQTAQSSGGGKGKLIIGCCSVVIILFLCICCSLSIVSYLAPKAFVNALMSDESSTVEVEKWEKSKLDETNQRIETELSTNRETTVTDEELTQIFLSDQSSDDLLFQAVITQDDKAQFNISIKSDDKYINVDALVDVEILNGKFTKFTVDKIKIGKFDLSWLLKDQNLADSINNDLNSQENKEGAEFIAYFDELRIEDGKFIIVLTEEGKTSLFKDENN